MPSHTFADRPAQPPEPGSVDALISQTRRLRGDVDAVRRDSVVDDDDAQGRWQRALCDLAVHHLDDLGEHLGQLKEGLPPAPALIELPHAAPETVPEDRRTRVGSAEWNLLTDEVTWSDELFQIFGRSPEAGALPLDELGSTLFSEDQPLLTAMVTACLVDGKPLDGEFRIVRADGRVRTLHMRGEPVLDSDGCTASMWAVLRDVSELRRSQRAVRESRDSLQRRREIAQTERRLAVELQEAVLPPWRGSLRFPHNSTGELDVAAQYLPSATSALIGGDWYDALELPGNCSMLTVGDLTGHGVTATSGMAMMLGALRGMAMAGIEPGPLMGWLNQLLETSVQPALGSAVCCRYDPARRLLSWAQAGHPAPLLFRRGQGRSLQPPEGVLLGATSGAAYGQAEERLEAGDVLVLHTDGLTPRSIEFSQADGTERLLALAPRFSAARSAQDCVRMVTEEFGESEREDDACVLVARIGG
ncbi:MULTISPECIES: PP2C family protein-serine/threonine phosphatase [unclassified Streptomyces]|uniref:PP2C family protein-serine/threonine phosphatase n=1 Tax=unclassified Streptomyces TaxID=2593676 RepID=UPI001BE96A1B|nr:MULTISPECIES: SpoIIE family protein phosphatase [unclassified Streptomyces]MBT2407162.1 SpoIIE family protein phosphatase [Streptomyces sp. ISL-21]MBT2457808.1 SpoIIE family protein phosphatase [Streptomyces sp. ISL-86]MBT2612810.1 SpoIIE family protein phosphatase [Streptomyces sp. ISL-87]